MTNDELLDVFETRVGKIRETLFKKGAEYAPDSNDRLSNFNRAGARLNSSREKALWGMAIKHDMSVQDLVDDIENGNIPSREMADEKIGDLITYLILLEACIVERIKGGYDDDR